MLTNLTPEERQQQIHALVEALRGKAPAERIPWLHEQCGGDLELFRAVLEQSREASTSAKDTDVGHSTGEWVPTPDPLLPLPPLVGQEVGGTYACQILKEHARGGMGEVFVAEDKALGRTVAFKRLQARHAGREESRLRFLTEAQITARLQHPGIVPIYGVTTDADGQPSYLMRFIEGETLADAIKKYHRLSTSDDTQRRLAFRELLTRFIAVCHTLAYAHAQGVIHRDIKPANIMLGKYGETLVVDWGLAKEVKNDDCRVSIEKTQSHGDRQSSINTHQLVTQEGTVMGTPGYMSPEQARGEVAHLGPATDIYALGATLFELLTGQPPLKGNLQEVLQATIAGHVPGPRSLAPAVPRALDAVCRKALTREPTQRYASPTELAQEIDRFLADEPVSAYAEPWTMKARRWLRRNQKMRGGMIVPISLTTILSIMLILSLTDFRAALKKL